MVEFLGLGRFADHFVNELSTGTRRIVELACLIDMAVVMGISDRVYCMEAGSVICTGSPDEVRADPLVIASYLGTTQSETSGPLRL